VIVLDVNVLVALFDRAHVHHGVATKWWREAQSGGVPVTAPDLVWVGFVRLATHPKVSRKPGTVAEAHAFMETFTAQPLYLSYAHQPRVIPEFTAVCTESQARGNLVTDAYIAASARALGAAVATFDRDFRRFDDLRLVELA
jgi:toxin-antitoxin system PIN domain toxin